MSGTMPLMQRFNVTVTAKAGFGDRQREAMGWQSARTIKVNGVPALTATDAAQKVLMKFGQGWKLQAVNDAAYGMHEERG